ncbi:MAG: hypothetical protein E6H07_03630 [Bacteroidetes bacterium]|nr:MAG: hypothetical protein E6H07_03630 [Bacteroidota bacterium]
MEKNSFDIKINSRLSFKPMIEMLKKNIADGNPGLKKLYSHLVDEIEQLPELLEPIDDVAILKPHTELIQQLLSTIFPPTNSGHENLHAVALPFTFHTVYYSRLFQLLFLKPGTEEINVPEDEIGNNLSKERIHFACHLVLKKYCGYHSQELTSTVYPYIDPHTGLTKYLELRLDFRFVDVKPIGDLPDLPMDIVCADTKTLFTIEELMQHVPLEKFVFEGLAIVRVNDVTETEVISRIKNSLLHINAFSDAIVYKELEDHVQSLIGLKGLKIGITPFFKVNGHYVYSELHNSNSLLFKHFHTISDKDEISDCCKLLFRTNDRPVVFEKLDEKSLAEIEYLKYYYSEGIRSLIVCPLKQGNDLIGILEITSETISKLNHTHISKIETAIPLFTLALEKSANGLDTQIDKIIKEQFTAIQPAVEWRFTEAALNYIVHQQKHDDVKMEKITFDDVSPLYGAIDIRNSSTERSHAIQLDLVEQLQMARHVIDRAQADSPFPLLQEIEFKLDKFIASASDVLLSDEENIICEFLSNQVKSLFNHIHSAQPVIAKEIENYFAALDPQLGTIYHHRKDYENSITKINDTLARFIDKEEAAAQKVFPHYFERYVTDGVDFNIYMGQSISPRKKFDEIYLRNLKMWQLSMMAKASRQTHKLESQLSHALKTTQLILSHSQPLTITFRTAERKFDVDGAYNVRYEIVKKRIDKVRIKDTNERLTQPGKIAIVYSQSKEAEEYLEYIEFLQNQHLLKPGVEHHDLEDLQGVVGLKALRVEIQYEEHHTEHKVELSNTTSQQLIGK